MGHIVGDELMIAQSHGIYLKIRQGAILHATLSAMQPLIHRQRQESKYT